MSGVITQTHMKVKCTATNTLSRAEIVSPESKISAAAVTGKLMQL